MDIKKKFNEMSVLSPALMAYTIVYMALMVYDFAARGAFDLPLKTEIMGVYIAIVAADAASKEIRRWKGQEGPPRAGSVFVYLWLMFFLVAYVIRSFWPAFVIPEELSKVALQVLGIFFGSKASKGIYELKTGKGAEAATREEAVMELIRLNGRVAKKDAMAKLSISDSTAVRLFDELEKKGLIRQEGQLKGAYYVLTEGK